MTTRYEDGRQDQNQQCALVHINLHVWNAAMLLSRRSLAELTRHYNAIVLSGLSAYGQRPRFAKVALRTVDESWPGTDQIRLFEVSGNTLTLTTRITDPGSGAEAHYAVVWGKAASA